MILFSLPGLVGAVLEAHHQLDLGPKRFSVELERLFATAVEE
jgi:hypothetical protein